MNAFDIIFVRKWNDSHILFESTTRPNNKELFCDLKCVELNRGNSISGKNFVTFFHDNQNSDNLFGSNFSDGGNSQLTQSA